MTLHSDTTKSTHAFVPNIPPASNLVLLSELPRIAPGTKVRFLGCVDSYDASSVTIILVDKYPTKTSTNTTASGHGVKARLDVSLVLPPVAPKELFEVGSWVTVVGYVAHIQSTTRSKSTRGTGNPVDIQVIMLLSSGEGSNSGGMQDERYTRAVEARRRGLRMLDKARETFAP